MKTDKDSNYLSLSKSQHDFDLKSFVSDDPKKIAPARADDILSILERNLELCLKKQRHVGFIIREISEVLKK